MSKLTGLQELCNVAFDDYIIPVYENAPNTVIQNRAQVTRSLKATLGVERTMFNVINKLSQEFGPNGEQVFEIDTKDNRFRFVGNWINQGGTAGTGPSIASNTGSDQLLEVTFYGTGLNWLFCYSSNTALDVRATIDGGAESANIIPANASNALVGYGYDTNSILPIVTGLTLGWHTVKLRFVTVNGISLVTYGVDIISENNLKVYPGTSVVSGLINPLTAITASDYREGVKGVLGARVVKYIEKNTVKSVVQEVFDSPKFLTAADHTNEEIIRKMHFTDFGNGQSNDFTTMAVSSGSQRLYWLDDNTTMLSGNVVFRETLAATGVEGMGVNAGAGTSWWTMSFVGTGLDLIISNDATVRTMNVYIDGILIGLMTPPVSSVKQIKICSGLPYGSHTIRLVNANAFGSCGVVNFLPYQIKKPSVPQGAFEVADYNIVANYQDVGVNGAGFISRGVIRKNTMREFIYTNGTWAKDSGAHYEYDFQGTIRTSSVGAKGRLTFFGTGFDFRHRTDSFDSTVVYARINDLLVTTANFPTQIISHKGPGGTSGFNTTTGVLNCRGSVAAATTTSTAVLSVYNLPLGWYTVEFENGNGSPLCMLSMDIITPVHVNFPSLKVGGTSMISNNTFAPNKPKSRVSEIGDAKAWLAYDMVNGRVIASYNIASVVSAGTGAIYILFEKPFKNNDYMAQVSSGTGEARINSSDRAPHFLSLTALNSAGTAVNTDIYAAFFGEITDENN